MFIESSTELANAMIRRNLHGNNIKAMGSIYLAWSLYLVTFVLPFPTECHFCLGRSVGGLKKKEIRLGIALKGSLLHYAWRLSNHIPLPLQGLQWEGYDQQQRLLDQLLHHSSHPRCSPAPVSHSHPEGRNSTHLQVHSCSPSAHP